ncbi:S8 family serine peptidase [Dactylosporangium vinaceum]|uniref:S8 family serine peptidase n=1 Tax=Dactylosporangium vinaceum TaxID=53362 RepID=A0ABV5M2B7_9ACTN|nr:S8 family serine peptidase [Dactylosporangium vinaceum]
MAFALAVLAFAGTVVVAGSPASAAETGSSVLDGAVLRPNGAKWNVESGAYTMADINAITGAQQVWGMTDSAGRKLTGAGVGVALIDSGIAPVAGLADPAKVANGPDLSFESQTPGLRFRDTFGHGTHMAGIIAGRDPATPDTALTDPSRFAGVAPGAHLVNLKVAAADGAADVSQVIAAIDWAVAHRDDPGLNIRVINLSYGTASTQDPRVDPLSYAVEAAWRNGIVVVVAGGNDGPAATRLTMPAQNPYVIAVGGADPQRKVDTKDDTVGAFSSRGNAIRHADLLAPGRSVASLRDPGSTIDVAYPTGLLTGDTAGRFFRGSGTSQAAAVTSGAAALLLQQRPNLTPDQVKKLLTSTATPLKGADPVSAGAGELDIAAAARAATPLTAQTFPAATGTGSLELARGGSHVADPVNDIELTGEQDIMGRAWNPATWAPAALAGTAWNGGTWNGSTWTGAAWTGTPATGLTWTAANWTGRTWSGQSWSGRTWSDAVWDGRTWSGRTWSGRTWSGRTWSGTAWT